MLNAIIRLVLAIGITICLCRIGCSIKECTLESLKEDMAEVKNNVPSLLESLESVSGKVDRLNVKIGDLDALYALLLAISNNFVQLDVSNKAAFSDISNEVSNVRVFVDSNRITLTTISNEVSRGDSKLNRSGCFCNCNLCFYSCCVPKSCFCLCRLIWWRRPW